MEFSNILDWYTAERALKVSFNLTSENLKASYNMGMGVVERTSNNPGKYEVPSREWFDLTDARGKFGVSVLEDSKFGSDKPNANTLRLTLVRTPKCTSYFDEATQDFGRHHVLFALAGHGGDWRQSDISLRGARLNQPLRAFVSPVHPGSLGKSFAFLRLNSTQVAVHALKKAESSEEIIIRLQELHGKLAKNVEVKFAAPIISAREVNGQEQHLANIPIQDGILRINMSPFSPRTFAVKLATFAQPQNLPKVQLINLPYNISVTSVEKEINVNKYSENKFPEMEYSFLAELFPSKLSIGGISFALGETKLGLSNAVSCKGQRISLPAGAYTSLYLLASSTGGDVKSEFKINGKPEQLTIQAWNGYVGQWYNRVWKNDTEILDIKPGFIKRANIAWFATHLHNKLGENLAYTYGYIFKYKIYLSKNAKDLTLPMDPRIKIFALSAAVNENDAAIPAQPLYD